MAGFFFCLASAEGAGLLFCPATIHPIQAFTAHSVPLMRLYHPRRKTAHRTLQGLFLLFVTLCRCYVAGSSGYIVPPALRWSVSQRRSTSSVYQYHHNAGRCTTQRRPPIIIRYIRVQGCAPVMDPCQTVQQIADHASPAGSSPTVCGSLASAAPGAPAEGSVSPPVQGQPGGVSILPTPGGLRSGTGSAVRVHLLAPSTRRDSPAAGARRAARNH